jgi:anaerobic magnesium-protoporphyrin IX monomethyl ester cyclase
MLINPPPFDHGENSRFLDKTPIQTYTMPLGLGYIAAVLEKAGYPVTFIDAYAKKLSYERLKEAIQETDPDIIGISCLSDQRTSWVKLIKLIRETDGDIKIVLGGAHPSLMPEQVLIHFQPDAIVIGEGELTMLDLVRNWERKADLGSVHGIAYFDSGKVVTTNPRERIRDLDTLPFPAYHMVEMADYSGWSFLSMLYEMLDMRGTPKYASISTSRGCIGNCGYCSSPLIWKRGWTQRSAIKIADEMEMLKREYGIEFIIMTDDIFTVDQKRVIALCDELIRRDLNLLWGFETAVNLVSPALLHAVKRAGCCCILFGVESASPAVLSKINKRITEEDVVKAFKWTRDAGILAGAFLMVGNPGETEGSIDKTIALLRRLQPDIILPQIAMITPCTKIFATAKEKGCIDESYWLSNLPFPYYSCERDLGTLLRWYKKLFYYKHHKAGILARTIRDYIEIHTGIRIRKSGIELVAVQGFEPRTLRI